MSTGHTKVRKYSPLKRGVGFHEAHMQLPRPIILAVFAAVIMGCAIAALPPPIDGYWNFSAYSAGNIAMPSREILRFHKGRITEYFTLDSHGTQFFYTAWGQYKQISIRRYAWTKDDSRPLHLAPFFAQVGWMRLTTYTTNPPGSVTFTYERMFPSHELLARLAAARKTN